VSELPRIQRVAAYNVCIDDVSRLLMCRLSNITERPGAWTLPGGGIDFGEHPEVGALRELLEETGYVGRIVELLAVDSIRREVRAADGLDADYHSVRIVYRTELTGGALRHETDESTDRAAWCTREELEGMPLVELGRVGVKLAFGDAT
jgi:8-oxo-dGTP diphosphatase